MSLTKGITTGNPCEGLLEEVRDEAGIHCRYCFGIGATDNLHRLVLEMDSIVDQEPVRSFGPAGVLVSHNPVDPVLVLFGTWKADQSVCRRGYASYGFSSFGFLRLSPVDPAEKSGRLS